MNPDAIELSVKASQKTTDTTLKLLVQLFTKMGNESLPASEVAHIIDEARINFIQILDEQLANFQNPQTKH